ncbi:MAG: EamA family transporter [Hyphomicrobiales bacterium]|nr:MAG: EamA family transporter [Hyphomicrobiales bacterium]
MSETKPKAGFAFFDRPYLLLALTALFWGGNAVAGKAAVGAVPPMLLTAIRWFLTSLILFAFARPYLKRDWPVLKAHWLRLFLTGALGMATFNLLLYNALHHTSAINVAIEQSGMPMIIVLVNFLLFSEAVSRGVAIGVILSIAGVIVTATHGNPTTLFDLNLNYGDALMLAAVAIYALYSVTLRHRPKLHWMSFMTALALAAVITALPFAIYEYMQGIVFTPNTKGFVLMVYVTLFPSLLSQIFYVRGVELIGANRAGLFVNLVPLFGSVLAVIFIGEQPALYHAVGYALILAGVYVAQRS